MAAHGMNALDVLVDHVKLASDGPPGSTPHFIGGVYAKEFRFTAGQVLVSHQHVYDHMSILAVGDAILRTPEGDSRLSGPCVVNVKAGVEHALVTETDCVWFCIHAVDQATKAYQERDPFGTDGLLIVKGA